MSCCLIECKFFIPNAEYVGKENEPLLKFENSPKEKRLIFKIPHFPRLTNRLRRLWTWLCFVWLHSRARKFRRVSFLLLVTLSLLASFVMFILIPLLFMNIVSMQRRIIFGPVVEDHAEFNRAITFHRRNSKTFYKPMNFYVKSSKPTDQFLGVWHLLPHDILSGSRKVNSLEYNFGNKYPVVLFFHATRGNRKHFVNQYSMLMLNFQVVTFDYRGYGDSSATDITEEGLVEDGIEMYKWLRSKTNASTYVWGDSLGATVAVEVVAKLHDEGIQPAGLILEQSPHSFIQIVQHRWPYLEMLEWLPWYKATILDPLEENGFNFDMARYSSKVYCSVMIWEWDYSKSYNKVVQLFNNTLQDASERRIFESVILPSYYKFEVMAHSDILRNYIRKFLTRTALKQRENHKAAKKSEQLVV